MSDADEVREVRERLTERGLVIDALLRSAKGEYPRRRNPRTGRLAWEYNIRRDEKRQGSLFAFNEKETHDV